MLAYLAGCQGLSDTPLKEVSCFTASTSKPFKQGASHHLGPARAGHRTSVRTFDSPWKFFLRTFIGDGPHSYGHQHARLPVSVVWNFLFCLLAGSILHSAGPNVAKPPHWQLSWAADVQGRCTSPADSAGRSVQCSRFHGSEPCPAASPVGLGSFPASSHMTLSLFTFLPGLPACGVPMPPRV